MSSSLWGHFYKSSELQSVDWIKNKLKTIWALFKLYLFYLKQNVIKEREWNLLMYKIGNWPNIRDWKKGDIKVWSKNVVYLIHNVILIEKKETTTT